MLNSSSLTQSTKLTRYQHINPHEAGQESHHAAIRYVHSENYVDAELHSFASFPSEALSKLAFTIENGAVGCPPIFQRHCFAPVETLAYFAGIKSSTCLLIDPKFLHFDLGRPMWALVEALYRSQLQETWKSHLPEPWTSL